MAEFTVYTTATGQIERSGFCTDGQEGWQAKAGEEVLIGVRANDEEQYVVGDELEERPIIPDLESVPAGTLVFVDGVSHGECNDGSVVIASDVPGTFRVRLAPPFPWRPYEEVVVIE